MESPPGTSHTRRLVLEQLGQMLVVASGFLDRLLLTALLLRSWDVSTFEAWSTCIALSSMVSLFELGFNLFFNNQLMIEMERGNRDALREVYATGNGLFLLSAVVGFAALFAVIFAWQPFGENADGSVFVAAIVLCAANSAKIALCAVYSLYRANREYGRFAAIQGISEIVRIAGVGLVVWFGASIVEASIASAVATTTIAVVFVTVDTRRRYFPHGYLVQLPSSGSLRGIFASSSLYMAQAVPVMLFISMPIIVLQKMTLAPGLIAIFVLVRTLSNVARAPLQSAGIVFGQEVGRLLAIQDIQGARRVTESSSRLFAVASGLASGVLLAGGAPLTRLWTGEESNFDSGLMLAAATPMILTPVAVLIHNVLVSHQAPLLPAVARGVQLVVTLFAFIVIGDLDAPLQMLSALSIGEVFGFAPVAYLAMAQLIPGLALRFHLHNLALALSTTALAASVTAVFLSAFEPEGNMELFVVFSLVGLLLFPAGFFMGVAPDGRRELMARIALSVRSVRNRGEGRGQ
jgi:O-antigen/teichoic acid export membrane protein